MFQFEYELTIKDYVKYNMYYQSHSSFFRKKALVSRIGLPIVFALILLIAIISRLSFDKVIILAAIAIVISVIYNVLFNQISTNILTNKVKDMAKENNLPFSKHNKLIFGNDTFTEITDTGENTVEYENIEKIVEIETLLLFYVSTLTACTIPLSVFESPEQKERFISFLESKSGVVRGETE